MVVTNESAERLAEVFPAYFDMIVLDAPCSGEGMFRKRPAAMDYWDRHYQPAALSCKKDSGICNEYAGSRWAAGLFDLHLVP